MRPSFGDKRSSGGWKGGAGGGRKPWKDAGSFRKGGNAVMHMATCASCGNSCQVPFKPNGRKPIFCSNCFKRDDREASPQFDRPSFNDRGPRDSGNSNMEARLAAIEAKIDSIIETLTNKEED